MIGGIGGRFRSGALAGALLLSALRPTAAGGADQGAGGGTGTSGEAAGASGAQETRPRISVPRVARPPAVEDFLSGDLDGGLEGTLARVGGFVQRDNHDGEPATRRTDAYLGYDDEHLYVVFLARDDPALVRGNLARRDEAYVDGNDDQVALYLDTFDDRRRAYYFSVNPEGVQFDSLYVEGQSPPGDMTFDLVWHAEPRRTGWGYVVRLAIPFRSLRFPPRPRQDWGIILERWSGRDREWALWPRVSVKVEGMLTQAGGLAGLENVSPGRNLRLVPYATFRASRDLDADDPGRAAFVTESADPDGGLDAKMVFNDRLVLDLTANPEFSQVESDEPQVTVNQRFEVLFPEKRPFFLENAGFFQTPIPLLFTRRIADPRAGLRLTGKAGRWAIGLLAADDEAPGRLRPPDDPLEGESARFGVARLSLDVLEHSSVGLILTDRELQHGSNRVGGVDARLRLNDRWAATLQAVTSATRGLDGERLAGPAYDLQVDRAGRHFTWAFDYNDVSPGFRSEPGFVRRTDVRRAFQRAAYRFRPDGRRLLWWGPALEAEGVWDHSGTRLDGSGRIEWSWQLARSSIFRAFYRRARERLRPQDFDGLPEARDFGKATRGFFFGTATLNWIQCDTEIAWGTEVNFAPPAGAEPELAELSSLGMALTLRPVAPLRIENRLLRTRLSERGTGTRIFTDTIVRSKWNWQFSREVSLRLIVQRNVTRADPRLTALESARNVNADLLFSWQVNPWTALYVGVNGNARNLDLVETAAGTDAVRARDEWLQDSRQLFVKYSYLFQF